MQSAFARAGLPEELFQLATEDDLARAGHVVALDPPPAKGTMLVLQGAPLDRAVTGAVWAAFAGGGRRHAALGRVITVRTHAPALAAAIERAAGRLRVGDPARPDTEVGPLPSVGTRDRVEALVAQAEAAGAVRLCGGPVEVPGVAGAFYSPVVLNGVPPGAGLLHEPVPGPVLALQEADGEEKAIELARDAADGTLSVWTADPAHGERIARAGSRDRLDQRARRRLTGHAGPAGQARRDAPGRLTADAPALGPLAAVRPGAARRLGGIRPASARPRVRALGGAAQWSAATRPDRGATRP